MTYSYHGCPASIPCAGVSAFDEELGLASLSAEVKIEGGSNDIRDDLVQYGRDPDYRDGGVSARRTIDHHVFTPPGLSAAKLTVTLDVPVLRLQEDGRYRSGNTYWTAYSGGYVTSEVRWTGCGESTCTTPLRDFGHGGTDPAAEGVQEAVVELRAAPGERVANVVVHTFGWAYAGAVDYCDPCTEDKRATAHIQFRVADVKLQGIN